MHDSSTFRRSIRALATSMSILLMFSGCGKKESYEVLGNVIFFRGTVTIKSGKENARHPQSATLASKLSAGDHLETSPNSMAALSLIPGIFAEAGAETEIVIDELRVQKQGDAMVNAMKLRLAKLHLNRGVIYASLPSVGSGECELNVQTSLGTLVAQCGALFSLRLIDETARVMCVDGEVHWSNTGGGHLDEIPPGYFRDYHRPDVPNGDVKNALKPVSEDGGAQNDVAAALETAAAFDDFALHVRNAQPPKSSNPLKPGANQPP